MIRSNVGLPRVPDNWLDGSSDQTDVPFAAVPAANQGLERSPDSPVRSPDPPGIFDQDRLSPPVRGPENSSLNLLLDKQSMADIDWTGAQRVQAPAWLEDTSHALDGMNAGDEFYRAPAFSENASPQSSDANRWINSDGQALDRDGNVMTESVTVRNGTAEAGSSQMDALRELLKKEEGYRTDVYRDSLKIPTVGIGHEVLPGDNLKVGDRIDDARANQFFAKDGLRALNAAKRQAAQAGISDPDFITRLASVNFQMGTGWTKTFGDSWGKIVRGDYSGAADNLGKTRWAKQTPVRVRKFQEALLALPSKGGF